MNRDIKKFLKLRTALVNEKARIEARLVEIAQVLGDVESTAPSVSSKRGGRRKFSEATKAKMRASQQARWAKKKGAVVSDSVPAAASTPAPKKPKKRKMSAAGRAAIVAAQKARWAKKKAAAGETGK